MSGVYKTVNYLQIPWTKIICFDQIDTNKDNLKYS